MGGSHSQQKKKLLFLGLDNAGKTSILHSIIGASPYTVAPTRGFSTKQIEFDNVAINVFDIGGQKSLRSHWGDYFNGASGVIWVIDSSDKRRMYETGLEFATLLQDDRLGNIPILIMANKQDLATALSAAEITTELELHSIRSHDWHIQACSATEKTGINEGLHWMVSSLKG